MALSSMTGFARGHGLSGTYSWAWELKSVNAKGLDLRLRLPAGWDERQRAKDLPLSSFFVYCLWPPTKSNGQRPKTGVGAGERSG